MARITNNQINDTLMSMATMLESITKEQKAMRIELDALKTKATTKKNAPKSTKKAQSTKKSSAKKTAPKKEATKTPSTKKATKGVNLADFEPCTFKDSDNYVWGGAKGYKSMRSAYCYAKQTNGKAKDLAGARKLGITIDFDKVWNKAKAEFEKKYVYVKKEDRQ